MAKTLIRTFGALICAAVAFAQSSGAAEAFARALQLQAAGDFEAAARAWREVIAAEPSNFGAHANLGATLAHQGLYENAIAEYKAALNSAPAAAVPAIRQNIGLALYKSGQLADAAAEFDAVRRSDPSQSNTLLLEADCYLRMGDFARVIELLSPLETSETDNRAVVYMLGMAYVRNGQATKGQAFIERLLRGGESAETHYLLGSVAFMARDYPAAIREFEAAAKLDPALPSLYSYYGRALLFSGDPDAALTAFQKQLEADPNDYDANFQLAEILRYRKDTHRAAPFYRKALDLRPGSLEARYGIAVCAMANGDIAGAQKDLERIISEQPQLAEAHRALAEIYKSLHREADAARELALWSKLPGDHDSGLRAGTEAPDFALLSASGETRVRLSSFRGHKPVVLVFGSYTCPKFRSQVDALNNLFDRYRDRAGFLLVYIREAHGDSGWQSTANQREGIELPDAPDLEHKRGYASMCVEKLKIRYPAVVDEMDNRAEQRWAAFPSRVYVIDRSGKVVFNSVLDQQQFDPLALESALKAAF